MRRWVMGLAAPLAIVGLCAATVVREADKAETARQAKAVLKKHCGACHNGSLAFDAGSVRDVVKKGYFVGGDPGASLGLQFVLGKVTGRSNKQMPPEPAPLIPDADRAVLQKWVADGALDPGAAAATQPAAPAPKPGDPAPKIDGRREVTEVELLKAIARDLEEANERDRPFLRYYSLANLYRSADVSDADLARYRLALDKLVNSLSWSPELAATKPLGPEKLLLRLDLRAVDWTPEIWQRIVAANPYGYLPREASAQATAIRALSGASFPYVRVDWFAATASVPPLYHEILDLPDTVDALEQKLGVDVKGGVEQEKAIRAGRRQSGVSRNNRVAERHRSRFGVYWKSYDFAGNVDRQNIFIDPINFREDGGEYIFSLPNGLQGYYIARADGRRLDAAPSEIVRDLDTPGKDPTIVNGLSCIGCHSQGMRTFPDQVRSHLETLQNQKTAFDLDHALALYKPQDVLQQAFRSDMERFQEAVKKLGGDITPPADEPVITLARYYLDNDGRMTPAQAAADVGLPLAEFQRRIGRSSRLQALGFSQLEDKNGGFKRDAWEEHFGAVVAEIRLGDYVAPTRVIQRGKSGATVAPSARLTAVHVGQVTCADQRVMDRVRHNLIFLLSRSPVVKVVRTSAEADAILRGQIVRKDGELTVVLTEEKRRIKEDITGLFSDLDFVTQQVADRIHFQLTGERLTSQPQVTAVTTTPTVATVRDPVVQLAQSLPSRGLAVSVDRGPGGTYKFGEEVPIRVKSDRDGALTVYNIDSQGAITLLFPNAFTPNNQIRAGQLVTIGDAGDPFKIQAQGVPGRETVIAVLTAAGQAGALPGVAEFRRDPQGKSLGVVARGASDFGRAVTNSAGSGAVQATVQFFTVKE